jgi:hypothetical protein
VRLTLRELKVIVKNAISEAVSKPIRNVPRNGYYHLSTKNLGDEFEFTPRRPNAPYVGIDGSVIEDDFTPRSSWAPSIDKALTAIEGLYNPEKPLYVYFVKSLPGKINLENELEHCPSSPQNDYNIDFSSNDWREWVDDVGDSKSKIKARTISLDSRHKVPVAFKGCVPDADETDEIWATKPIKARLIGDVVNGMFVSK